MPLQLLRIRFVLAADTWERHAVAARLLGPAPTVLDVGGTVGTLAPFVAPAHVTSANVAGPADVIWAGGALPFADASFDAVTSLDVLEHLPRAGRALHLRELARVARATVVLCCPLGSPEHVAAERELQRRRPHRFLAEHLALGLPTDDELAELTIALPGSWQRLYHGDSERSARRHLRPRASRLDVRRDTTLHDAPTSATNRVFVVGRR